MNELVANAFEHAFAPAQPGEISIALDQYGRTGHRIDCGQRPRACRPDSDLENGTGLGLQIVRTLVEKDLAGTIRLECRDRRRYSRRLNVLQVRTVKWGRRMPAEPLRVLIADDESIRLLSLRAQLPALGHKVVAEASNGQEAVVLAKATQPDLAIMDIKMPIMDGIEAAEQITEERPIPIILLTAYSEAATGRTGCAGQRGRLPDEACRRRGSCCRPLPWRSPAFASSRPCAKKSTTCARRWKRAR